VNRWLALLLGIVGGGAIAFAVLLAFVPALYGFLWIFVFGDDSWPDWVDQVSNIAIPLIGLAIWVIAGWFIWKRLVARRRAG
jgi:hypothetical protein